MAGWRERWGSDFTFAPSQRRVLTLLLAALIGYGVFRYATHRVYIDAPQPEAGDRAAELADKLDPNTATAADLAALPGLGDKRAGAIVARREKVRARDKTDVAFVSADDLLVVPGFGRSTVEQLRPFLVFPTTQKSADKNRTTP